MVSFIGSVAHVSDVGGHAGDIEAADVFEEGMRLPPCKLYEAGRPNELVFEIIGNNCRVPNMVLGDIHAMVGTHRIGAQRVREFLDDYDLDDLCGLAAEIHGRSEALVRQKISALTDGVYEFGLDIDGYIEVVHLQAKVTISGSDVLVDYTGARRRRARPRSIACITQPLPQRSTPLNVRWCPISPTMRAYSARSAWWPLRAVFSIQRSPTRLKPAPRQPTT